MKVKGTWVASRTNRQANRQMPIFLRLGLLSLGVLLSGLPVFAIDQPGEASSPTGAELTRLAGPAESLPSMAVEGCGLVVSPGLSIQSESAWGAMLPEEGDGLAVLPDPRVTIQVRSQCGIESDTAWSVQSDDRPTTAGSVPMHPWVIQVEPGRVAVEFVELWQNGKPFPLPRDADTGVFLHRVHCPNLGLHKIQARYKSQGVWSGFSREIQLFVRPPTAPQIVGLAEERGVIAAAHTDRPIRIQTSALQVQLAGVEPADLLAASIDGQPVRLEQRFGAAIDSAPGSSAMMAPQETVTLPSGCTLTVPLRGQIPVGLHTLVVRRRPSSGGCGVASPPSNIVAFLYAEDDQYILGPQAHCCPGKVLPFTATKMPTRQQSEPGFRTGDTLGKGDLESPSGWHPSSKWQIPPPGANEPTEALPPPMPGPAVDSVANDASKAEGEASLLKRSSAGERRVGAEPSQPGLSGRSVLGHATSGDREGQEPEQFVAFLSEALTVESNAYVLQATSQLPLIQRALARLQQLEALCETAANAIEQQARSLDTMRDNQQRAYEEASTKWAGLASGETRTRLKGVRVQAEKELKVGDAARRSLEQARERAREHTEQAKRTRIAAELDLRQAEIALEQARGFAQQVSLLETSDTTNARIARDEVAAKLNQLKRMLLDAEARVVAVSGNWQTVETTQSEADRQVAVASQSYEASGQSIREIMVTDAPATPADGTKKGQPKTDQAELWKRLNQAEIDLEATWQAAEVGEAIRDLKKRADDAILQKEHVDVRRHQLEADDAEDIAFRAESIADTRIRIAQANLRTQRAEAIQGPASPIFFASAAHFPRREFTPEGQVIEREGLIIYEDMQFAFDREGNYQLTFRTNQPTVPVVLQLQLQLQPAPQAAWYTITLPPIVIKTTMQGGDVESERGSDEAAATDDRSDSNHGCCGPIRNCNCSGQSEILKRCYAELGMHPKIKRVGTARFGYGNKAL